MEVSTKEYVTALNYSASEVYDLAIVGAGPAGAMAAYAAAKRGLKSDFARCK